MADYKVVDIEQLEAGLIATADAIRAKTGNTDQIDWKTNGMADEINKISTGVDVSKDTVLPDKLLEGIIAHNSSGEQIIGTIKNYGGEVR